MSYKTNPIANRLKLTKGWKFSSFPTTKKKYAPEIIQGLKLYLVLTAYLQLKQIKIAKLEIRKTENNTKIIVLTIHKTKSRKIRKKKKSLTKRNINIKLARIKAKKAINYLYNDLALLKKLSPFRFSTTKKHSFQYKWVANTTVFNIMKHKTKKKLINFLKYKRIHNKKYFLPKEKDFFNTSSKNIWSKPVYFLQKKYKSLLNQAKYYKAKGNQYEKLLNMKPSSFIKNSKKKKATLETYIIFLKSVQNAATKSHIIAAKYYSEAAILLHQIKEEHNGLVCRDTTRLSKNRLLSSRRKKIKYILKNAKISLVLLKKFQKYRSFYKKDLLKLLVLQTKQKKNKIKKKYYFDIYNLSLRTAHLNYHTQALGYTMNNNIRSCDSNYIYVLLKKVSLLKKRKKLKNFLKLSLFLRKIVLKNLNIFKKKRKRSSKNKKKIKYFLKKQISLKLLKKNKKIENFKLKTFLDVIKNLNFKDKQAELKNKKFNKKTYLKHQRVLTRFRLSHIIYTLLNNYYNTNVVVKVINFVESYKNNKIRKKIYSRRQTKQKKKVIGVLKKSQKFIGRTFSKKTKKKKLIKPINKLVKEKTAKILLTRTTFSNKKSVKNAVGKVFFKKLIKKTYLNKLKTMLKKKKNKINLPNPWEKSEENIFKRIQEIRAEGLKKNQFLSRFIPVLMILNKTLNAQILADQIAFEFERTKNHWPLISSIRSALNVIRFKKLKGYRVGISGKINASSRTRSVFISKGNLPVQTFSERLNFAAAQARARTGTFGIRVWLYY
jgi:ribosomal protein S3